MSQIDKKIRAVLVDDEKPVRDLLRQMLSSFSYVEVVGEAANIPEAVREIHKSKPDLVFLDIEMPGYSGIQLLEFFNPQEVDFDIVFVTAYNEYAIQAFKISAFDYLLKPVDSNELENCLKRFLEVLNKEYLLERAILLKGAYFNEELPLKIAVTSLQGIDFIDLSNLVNLEASGTYTNLYLQNGDKVVSSKPLGEFEQLLSKHHQFFRTHRSHMINLNHIRKLSSKEGDVITMDNGQDIPISRYRKRDFDQAISGYKI